MRRAAVCFIAPGHTMLSTAGSTRNILATAQALSEWVDVKVVFRNVAEKIPDAGFEIDAIEPFSSGHQARDDVAARGLNPLAHFSYLRKLREFVADSRGEFDLVLEKGWRLSGYMCREYSAHGTPSILVENDARAGNEKVDSVRGVFKLLAHTAAEHIARRGSRAASMVVAETQELKAALVERRGLISDKVKVVPLGVEHAMFYPMDSKSARGELGLAESKLIMLYVGGMDQYHDLSPLLKALASCATAGLELHIVGDGEYRQIYEDLARVLSIKVVFHGQVKHETVPMYIAAADLCLAPYQASGFHNDQVAFSTLKIPEYMACGRPVVSIPSGNIKSLVSDGVTGFLFDNEVAGWQKFLETLPSKSKLAEMGSAAAPTVASLSWRETARQYLELAGEHVDMSLYCDRNHSIETAHHE